ncbi:MAG: heat-inducible transcription repressor HrcA [Nitrospirae bacterium]|nr:heat-inducible transcription repressor HrcA [Nitrospirota bacterium]
MLDDRSKQILQAVIQLYISSPGPVGSRAVTKKFPIGLSPATIRNIMSDLEDMGFLRQPHTSAGRVPTDSGYRYYVDALAADRPDPDTEFASELSRKLELIRTDVNSFLDSASRMLSELSHYIGISVSPNAGQTTLSRIELVPYRKNQIAVILITDEAVIRNRIISVDQEMSREDLNRLAGYINERFGGHTLDDIRKTILEEMADERVLCDDLITEAMSICRNVFPVSESDIFISGVSEALTLPDFCDIGRIRGLLRTIEDKHVILSLLEKISETDSPQVFIGSENPLDELKQFSLIAAPYREGSRPIGAIAIIGPTRMNYSQAITLVDITAKFITDIFSYSR